MQDRVSLYPGRVKLEPVAGQANLYDLTRADQPTQEGTPLNKANLLSDATAAAIKALLASQTENPATPNEALNVLTQAVEAVTTVAAGKCSIENSTYTGNGKTGSANPVTLTFPKKPIFIVVFGYTSLLLISDKCGNKGFGLGFNSYGTIWRGEDLTVTWTGSTLKYYCDYDATQANVEGKVYQVIAFYAQN